MNDRQRRHIIEVMPLMLICTLLLLYCFVSAMNYGRLADSMPVLSEEQLFLDYETELFAPAEKYSATLTIILPREFEEERSICFYSSFQEVDVRLDGNLLYSFRKSERERIIKAAPSIWNQLALPADSAGGILVIELTTPYAQYGDVLPEVRSGSAEQVAAYVHMKTLPRFIAALAILFIGLVFAVVAVVMRYYVVGSTGLYSLSLFIVVLAAFLVAQQTSILLKINANISYVLMQNIALMLCPVMYSRYLMRMHSGRLYKFDRIIHIASLVNLAAVCLIQLCGIGDMPQRMQITRVLCGLLIAYEFIEELRRKRRLLICGFGLLLIYASVRYYLTDTITWLLYVGIFIYIYVVIYRVISSVVGVQARQIRLKAQLEVSRSEIATIQITSHFFYHTLDSIRALIRLDADKAYKMTGDFAKYVRHRVDGVERMQELVPFSRELRSIRAYTDIKQAQLGERFQMEFDVETEDFEILPLTVQPLVENAVIHAVQRRRDGGRVRLVCRETREGYHIEVIDNGPGSAAPEAADAQKESTAMRNLNTRLEYYGIALPVSRHNEAGGLTVSLDMPKKIIRKGNEE